MPASYIMLCFLVIDLFKTHLHCFNCLESDCKKVYYKRYAWILAFPTGVEIMK